MMTDSDDIVERLRRVSLSGPDWWEALNNDAADEIERLRSDRERIRNIADRSYNRISGYLGHDETEDNEAAYWCALGEILEMLDD